MLALGTKIEKSVSRRLYIQIERSGMLEHLKKNLNERIAGLKFSLLPAEEEERKTHDFGNIGFDELVKTLNLECSDESLEIDALRRELINNIARNMINEMQRGQKYSLHAMSALWSYLKDTNQLQAIKLNVLNELLAAFERDVPHWYTKYVHFLGSIVANRIVDEGDLSSILDEFEEVALEDQATEEVALFAMRCFCTIEKSGPSFRNICNSFQPLGVALQKLGQSRRDRPGAFLYYVGKKILRTRTDLYLRGQSHLIDWVQNRPSWNDIEFLTALSWVDIEYISGDYKEYVKREVVLAISRGNIGSAQVLIEILREAVSLPSLEELSLEAAGIAASKDEADLASELYVIAEGINSEKAQTEKKRALSFGQDRRLVWKANAIS